MKKLKIKTRTLCAWTIENLPDSSAMRRKLLEGVVEALPEYDAVCNVAMLMLHQMDQFDKAQQELAFDFHGGLKVANARDGHDGNGGKNDGHDGNGGKK